MGCRLGAERVVRERRPSWLAPQLWCRRSESSGNTARRDRHLRRLHKRAAWSGPTDGEGDDV